MPTAKRAAVVVEQMDGTGSGAFAAVNRRASQRLVVDWEVDYQSEENYLFASIVDISATGIFVKTITPHTAGTQLNLRFVPVPASERSRRMQSKESHAALQSIGNSNERFFMEDSELMDVSPIEVLGEVAWTNQFNPQNLDNLQSGMGIRFIELGEDTKRRLLELIRRIAYLPEVAEQQAD